VPTGDLLMPLHLPRSSFLSTAIYCSTYTSLLTFHVAIAIYLSTCSCLLNYWLSCLSKISNIPSTSMFLGTSCYHRQTQWY